MKALNQISFPFKWPPSSNGSRDWSPIAAKNSVIRVSIAMLKDPENRGSCSLGVGSESGSGWRDTAVMNGAWGLPYVDVGGQGALRTELRESGVMVRHIVWDTLFGNVVCVYALGFVRL